jgi:hypothetical protein
LNNYTPKFSAPNLMLIVASYQNMLQIMNTLP